MYRISQNLENHKAQGLIAFLGLLILFLVTGCLGKKDKENSSGGGSSSSNTNKGAASPQTVVPRLYIMENGASVLAALESEPDYTPEEEKKYDPLWTTFTPESIKVPILEITAIQYHPGIYRNISVLKEEVIYQCPSANPKDCLVEFIPGSEENLLNSMPVRLPSGFSIEGLSVLHCEEREGFTQYIKGYATLGERTYRTSEGGLVEDGGSAEFQPVHQGVCARDFPINTEIPNDGKPIALNIFTDINDYAWTGQGYYESFMSWKGSYCAPDHKKQETEPVLCASIPDYVISTKNQFPILKRFAYHQKEENHIGGYNLFFTQEGASLGGYPRHIFREHFQLRTYYDLGPPIREAKKLDLPNGYEGYQIIDNQGYWYKELKRGAKKPWMMRVETDEEMSYWKSNGIGALTFLGESSSSPPTLSLPSGSNVIGSLAKISKMRPISDRDFGSLEGYPSKPTPFPRDVEKNYLSCLTPSREFSFLDGEQSYLAQEEVAQQIFLEESKGVYKVVFDIEVVSGTPESFQVEVRSTYAFDECWETLFCPNDLLGISAEISGEELLRATSDTGGQYEFTMTDVLQLRKRTLYWIVLKTKKGDAVVRLNGTNEPDYNDNSVISRKSDGWKMVTDFQTNFEVSTCIN
jgi:hypothetical protein